MNRNSWSIRICVLLIFMFLSLGSNSQERCVVEDVVDLVKEKLTLSQVLKQCSSVRDGGTCSVTQAYRYAKEDALDADEIKEKCTSKDRQSRPVPPQNYPPQNAQRAGFCVTNFGSCPLGMFLTVGSPCYCPTLQGPVWGFAR